jgi:hypothetical protein
MLDLAIHCNFKFEFLLGKQVKNYFIYDFCSFKVETSSASYNYRLANKGCVLSDQGLAETNLKTSLHFRQKC